MNTKTSPTTHSMSRSLLRYGASLIALIATMLLSQPVAAQVPRPTNLESLVKYMQAHHQAPFNRDSAFIPREEALKLQRTGLRNSLASLTSFRELRAPVSLLEGCGAPAKVTAHSNPKLRP
jgi:hypothetical protein